METVNKDTAPHNAGQPVTADRPAVASFMEQWELRRRNRGLSYADIARRMGVSRAYVSRLANRPDNLTVATLAQLARAVEAEVAVNLITRGTVRRGSRHGGCAVAGAGRHRVCIMSAATGRIG